MGEAREQRCRGEIPDEIRAALKNLLRQKILLAMKIRSDTNDSRGVSRGSISRRYEGVGKNPFLHPYFERLFGHARRRHGL
jgi:hypothetical protein